MKSKVVLAALVACLCVPAMMAQSTDTDHVELGIFADYFNLSRTSPNINFVGVGGRAGFNVHPNIQLEAEMSYDFGRNFTSVFDNGINMQFFETRTRPLHALFGPKFQTGSGALRAFATVKLGFVNFSSTTRGPLSGFEGSLGGVTSGSTQFALYPGVGVEGFLGPFGLRADIGDDIYFDNGARHNLKATFGPVFRF
jgi:hypothetical protein